MRWTAGLALAVAGFSGCADGPSSDAHDLACVAAALPFGGGEGTASDPYRLCAADQLDRIGLEPSASFRLVADLDLSERPLRPNASFSGDLDGGGHTLTGLSVEPSGERWTAWIGRLNGSLRHLRLEAVDVRGERGVAVVRWVVDGGRVEDLSVEGRVSASEGEVAGALGVVEVDGLATGVSFAGEVTAGPRGHAAATIEQCRGVCAGVSGSGLVRSEGWKASGLVSYVPGVLSEGYSDVRVEGNSRVAGIVTVLGGTMEDCWFDGEVRGTEWVAGLVGENYGGTEAIVRGSGTSDGALVGHVWDHVPLRFE